MQEPGLPSYARCELNRLATNSEEPSNSFRQVFSGNMKRTLAVASLALLVLAALPSFGVAYATEHGSVYTIDNSAANSVLQFQAAGGVLSLVGTYSTHGSGTGSALASQGAVAISNDGHWLVTVDAGSNQVTAFQVNGDGSLTFASIAGSHGTMPISVTISRDVVYVLNAGTSAVAGSIAGFTLGNDGQLTYIAGSSLLVGGAAGSSPEQIGFNNRGNVLVVTEKAANLIDTYTVAKSGLASGPTTIASNSAGPYGFAFTNKDDLVISEAATGTLSSYSVSRDGTLTTISGSIPDFGSAPCWVAVTQDGRYAYTSNAHGGTISSYSISGRGALILRSSVAASTSIPTLDLAFNSNSHFLFVLNGGHITSFEVHPDGRIAQVSVTGALAGSATGLAAS
jgi:6-phosphogluconolactonase